MESPGTAPGSDPLITSAFMSIVRRHAVYRRSCRGLQENAVSVWRDGFAATFPYFSRNFGTDVAKMGQSQGKNLDKQGGAIPTDCTAECT